MRCVHVYLLLLVIGQAAADCESDIEEYIQGLDPTEPQLWSMEMLDSSVKYPTDGIHEGTFMVQFGNYDQCLAIRGPTDESGVPRFKGKYCHFNFGYQTPAFGLLNETFKKFNALKKNTEELALRGLNPLSQTIELPFLWAVCAPSSCAEDGVKKIANLNMAAFSNFFGIEANSSIQPNSCYFDGDGSKTFDALTWCFIVFSTTLALWICFSTVYEHINPNMENDGWKIFIKSFSLQTNLGELTRLPSNPAPGQLGCLHGMRVISMLWIVVGHAYMYSANFPASNYISKQFNAGEHWTAAPLVNGFLSVDTFLFLSGLLITYVPLMDHSKGRKFNVWKYYIYRYFRIAPAVAFLIWYLSSLNFYMSHGPMWYLTAGRVRTSCYEYWWPTLLFISNYFYYSFCIGQTWYLMVDMQLAFLAPLVIFPLIKKPKYGIGLIGLLTCVCLGLIFGVTYVKNYPWTYINKLTYDNDNYMLYFYATTPLRAVPYFVGMALGYHLSKKTKIEISKWAVALGWFLSTVICLTIIYIIVIPYDDDYVYEPVAASFYASLHKLGWGLGMAWIVWACVNGYGGPVNSILSWKYFLPLSKLSFAIYLVHGDIMNFQRGMRRTVYFISNLEMLYMFSGHFLMSLPVSILLYVAVEMPIVNVLRSFFKKLTNTDASRPGKLQKEN